MRILFAQCFAKIEPSTEDVTASVWVESSASEVFDRATDSVSWANVVSTSTISSACKENCKKFKIIKKKITKLIYYLL